MKMYLFENLTYGFDLIVWDFNLVGMIQDCLDMGASWSVTAI